MGDLLSTISSKFDASSVLGTLFPVGVFVVLFRLLVLPLLAPGLSGALLAPFVVLGQQWEWVFIFLVSIVLAGILYNLNTPLIKWYEGYPWKDTWIGRARTEDFRGKLNSLREQSRLMLALFEKLCRDAKAAGALPNDFPCQPPGATARVASVRPAQASSPPGLAASPGSGSAIPSGEATQAASTPPRTLTPDEKARLERQLNAAGNRAGELIRQINNNYPRPSSVLPTELGNVIRSFENYAEGQYGIATIPMWPRLIAKIDKDYAKVADQAKASFDFMLNSATLSGLLAFALLLAGLLYPSSLPTVDAVARWLVGLVTFAGLAVWFYHHAIGQARVWGNLVKGSWDLYRLDLLKQFGYTRIPKDQKEERVLWREISSQISIGQLPPGSPPPSPYGDETPTSRAPASGALKIDIQQTAGAAGPAPAVTITLGGDSQDSKAGE